MKIIKFLCLTIIWAIQIERGRYEKNDDDLVCYNPTILAWNDSWSSTFRRSFCKRERKRQIEKDKKERDLLRKEAEKQEKMQMRER